MTQENINYRNNLRSFTDTIKDAFVTRVNFHVDLNPTFDKKIIPFDFKYCHAVTLIADGEMFLISTSMTTSGADTFWITPTKTIKDSTSFLQVDSKVKKIDIKSGDGNFVFKINIEFEKSNLILFAGEIYDIENGGVDYKINDEMILVFDNVNEADTFEKSITTANNV